MSSLQEIVNQWLASERFTQVNLLSSENQSISQKTRDLETVATLNNVSIISTFGFVPTFDQQGNVSIYARFGGPERILYTPSLFENNSVSKFVARFGKGANPFVNKVGKASNSKNLLYQEALATERYNLQDIILNNDEHANSSLYSLRHTYPFRIVFLPKADTQREASIDLQFRNPTAQGFPYRSLLKDGQDNEKAQFVIYLLQGCAQYLLNNNKIDELETLRNAINDVSKIQQCVTAFQNYFVSEFIEQLELRGARLFATTRLTFEQNNGHDWLFRQFILEMQSSQDKKLTMVNVLNLIKTQLEKEIQITTQTKSTIQNFFEKLSIVSAADHELQTQLQDTTQTLTNLKASSAQAKLAHDSAITSLEQKLKTQAEDFERQNRFEFSMLGAAAGVGAAYYTLYKDKPDLENWERGAILAVGGLLGSIPYLNLVSIAATPILIEKGIEFKKNRS